MFISIVIAVYDEEKNVKELTERIYSSMQKLKIDFELIYVIDGTDNTYNILKDMQKTHKNLIMFYSQKRRGFAAAFKKGFREISSKATHILTMDGDLNHQPEEIRLLIKKMKNTNADIVIGSRYIKGGKIDKMPLWKRMVSAFANIVLQLRFELKIKDKTSGYRLYKCKVIDSIIDNLKYKNFEVLMEILIKAKEKGYKIIETPIHFKMRIYGKSKFQFFKMIIQYIKLFFSYKNKKCQKQKQP